MIDARWMNVLAGNLSSADLSIVACVVAIIFFMRYNRHEAKNKGNLVMCVFLGIGFLMLVGFRMYIGIR